MNAEKIKQLMIKRCSFGNGYVGAVTEVTMLNAADVIAVKFGGTIQEFEIKVSRSDLIGEMRCARVAAGLDDVRKYTRKEVQQALLTDDIERTAEQTEMIYERGHTLSETKLTKHRMYLTKPKDRPVKPLWAHKRFIPNVFYWCIPYSLLEVCRELNKGLPYGIYVYDYPQPLNSYSPKYFIKNARSIGAEGSIYYDVFNRACTQWADDRHRIEFLERELEELKKA